MPGSDPTDDDQITPLTVWHPLDSGATLGALKRLALFCCGMMLLAGFLSGCGGIYLCTTCQASPSLASISMVSADEGWAVGRQGAVAIIVHYQGGKWSRVYESSGYSEPLSSIDMLSASEGWSVGSMGPFYATATGSGSRMIKAQPHST
jgi:hypothetical protein